MRLLVHIDQGMHEWWGETSKNIYKPLLPPWSLTYRPQIHSGTEGLPNRFPQDSSLIHVWVLKRAHICWCIRTYMKLEKINPEAMGNFL